MRLPVVPQISTKDGVSAKNARLTNCLKETTKRGDKAVIRPGLVLNSETSGVGGGLVSFNDELVSVYGTTLGFGIAPGGLSATQDVAAFDPYGAGRGLLGLTASDGTSTIVAVGVNPTVIYLSSDSINFSSVFSASLGGTAYPDTGFGLGYYWLFVDNGTAADCKLYRSDTTATAFTLVHTFLNSSLPATHRRPYFWFSGSDMYVAFVGNSDTYRFVSSDNGATWSGSTVVANLFASGYYANQNQQQMIGFGSKFYAAMFDGSGQTHIASTADNMATVSFSSAIGLFAGYQFGFVAGVGATIYRFYIDASTNINYDYSTDGTAWTSGGVIYTHAAGKACTLASWATVGSNVILYIFETLSISPFTITPSVIVVSFNATGTIPPLATISIGKYDFAQSPL